MRNSKKREALFHIAKRDTVPWWKGILIRLLAIAISLIVCAFVVVFLTDLNPLAVYKSLFEGAFGSSRKIWMTAQNTAILLCVSLAVTPAFKMKFWNIGAEGQVLMGCLGATACMVMIGDSIPSWALILIMAVVSTICGCIWAVIPAFFKANWNTNETLFTLMMNYVAIQLVSCFTIVWENPKGSSNIGVINRATKAGWFPALFGKPYLLNILIVAALTVFLYIYLKYSKQGYEISVVGESVKTARYVGMNVKKIIIRTVALSGAICGIAGLLLVAGTDHTITVDTAGGRGFTAIMVSWLAKFNPLIMTLTSFLLSFLDRGAGEIATTFRLNHAVTDILTGIILFFIIGCEFFINYKIIFRSAHKEESQNEKDSEMQKAGKQIEAKKEDLPC